MALGALNLMQRRRPVSLALQGGGAHGAFGWGVMHALYEDASLDIRAMSAASAGAMNAVTAASGAFADGPQGARARLHDFWSAVARAGALMNPSSSSVWTRMLEGFGLDAASTSMAFFNALARATSPYDLNPLNFHPLRSILDEFADFDAIRASSKLKLFISTTNAKTGALRVFTHKELSADAVLASACLPHLFQAVEIDGEPYWDGGYAANPALYPLFYRGAPRDVIIVHLNPINRDAAPTGAEEILNRMNEVSFNAPLLAELRGIALARRAVKHSAAINPPHPALRVRLHAISADEALKDMPLGSKYNTEWAFLTDLFERGRDTAKSWLAQNQRAIGKRSTMALPDSDCGWSS